MCSRARCSGRPRTCSRPLFRIYYQKLDKNSLGLFQPPTSANTIGAGDPSNGDFVSTRALLQPSSDDITAPSLTLNFDFGWSQLKILSSYLHRYSPRDYDYTAVLPPALGFPIPTSLDYAEPTVVGTGQNNSTQEIRLQSPDRGQDFTWIVGALLCRSQSARLGDCLRAGFPGGDPAVHRRDHPAVSG